MTLSFVSFELEQSEHCNTDYVEVRSGKSDGTLLGVFCGSDLPTNITAHNAIWLRFRSDASNTAPGFMADYSLGMISTFLKVIFAQRMLCYNTCTVKRMVVWRLAYTKGGWNSTFLATPKKYDWYVKSTWNQGFVTVKKTINS